MILSKRENTRRSNPYIKNNTNAILHVAKRLFRRVTMAKPRHIPTWRPVWGPKSVALMVARSRIDRGKYAESQSQSNYYAASLQRSR